MAEKIYGDRQSGRAEIKNTIDRLPNPENIKRKVIERLADICSRKSGFVQESGAGDYDRNEISSLNACVQELNLMRKPSLRDMQIALFRHRISGERVALLEKQTNSSLVLKSSDLKEFVKDECGRHIHEDLTFKNDGGIFLADAAGSSIKEGRIDVRHVQKLQELAAGLRRKGYTEKNTRTMYTMYAALLHDESLTLPAQPTEDVALEMLSTIVEARLNGDPETSREGSRGNFFDEIAECIAVYADITQEVLLHSGDISSDIRRKAMRSLSKLIQRPQFQETRWRRGDPQVNPFEILQQMLREGPSENPWTIESLDATPFDERKFSSLLTPDVPRGLLAEAVVILNNYHNERLAQQARYLQGLITRNLEEKGLITTKQEEMFESLVSEYSDRHAVVGSRRYDTDEDKLDFLEEVARLSVRRTKEEIKESHDIHPNAVLLRLISPQKIFADKTLRDQFLQMFAELEFTGTQSPTQISVVGSSVREVLESGDPYLHIPLIGTPDDKPLRTLITRFADTHFDNDVRRKGPYIHLKGAPLPPERALYTPADLREYANNPARLRALKKNFSSAAGIGLFKRHWLRTAAEAWHEHNQDPSYNYEQMKEYAIDMGRQFYGLATGTCSLTYYRSATIATGDFVGNLLQIKEGDRVLITNQEITSITKEFSKRGAEITPKEIIYVNDRDKGRSLTVEELFQQYKKNIEEEGLPRAIIISTKTRFGDAPCPGSEQSDPKKQRPNAIELQRLIKLLKTAYPTVAVGLDGCQSIGRNDDYENRIERLGCDFFISSGSKAMGVPEAAVLILRTKFPKDQPNWLSGLDETKRKNPMDMLQPGVGTDNIESIAALAMAMQIQLGRENPWGMTPISEKGTLRDMASLQMKRLTRYFIDKASKYHLGLFDALFSDKPISIARPGSEKLDQKYALQFGCYVVYPVHRVEANYNGMATVAFPNLSELTEGKPEEDWSSYTSNYLPQKLRERGFQMTSDLLKGRHAIRFDFNMVQDFADIDELFKAIQEIHVEFLRSQIKAKNIQTVEQLCEKTPNLPTSWIES